MRQASTRSTDALLRRPVTSSKLTTALELLWPIGVDWEGVVNNKRERECDQETPAERRDLHRVRVLNASLAAANEPLVSAQHVAVCKLFAAVDRHYQSVSKRSVPRFGELCKTPTCYKHKRRRVGGNAVCTTCGETNAVLQLGSTLDASLCHGSGVEHRPVYFDLLWLSGHGRGSLSDTKSLRSSALVKLLVNAETQRHKDLKAGRRASVTSLSDVKGAELEVKVPLEAAWKSALLLAQGRYDEALDSSGGFMAQQVSMSSSAPAPTSSGGHVDAMHDSSLSSLALRLLPALVQRDPARFLLHVLREARAIAVTKAGTTMDAVVDTHRVLQSELEMFYMRDPSVADMLNATDWFASVALASSQHGVMTAVRSQHGNMDDTDGVAIGRLLGLSGDRVGEVMQLLQEMVIT